MITKLLLIRKKMMTSTLIAESGLQPLVVGEPLNVSPLAWAEESGLSHFAFKVEFKFKQLALVAGFADSVDARLLHLSEKDEIDEEKALAAVGLRIHPSA